MNQEFDFQKIFGQFDIKGEFLSCTRYGEGHINDTFKLTVLNEGKEEHYILQRINNRLFREVDKLMHNIELVTDFCRKSVVARGGDPKRECLTLIRTKKGKSYYCDGKNYFRIYVFIEDAMTYQIVRNPQDFYESAVAFGSFANLLADFDADVNKRLKVNFDESKLLIDARQKAFWELSKSILSKDGIFDESEYSFLLKNPKLFQAGIQWRKGRDSNPRYG